MKIKHTYEGAFVSPEVAAEIEALHMEIRDLKKALRLTIDVVSDAVWALRSFKEQRLMDANNIIG